jgi:threonylcarbamoyladenosine tRNA methylthiotransferase MtaB
MVNDIMAVKETAAQFVDSFADHTRAVLRCKWLRPSPPSHHPRPGNSRSVGVGAVRGGAPAGESGFNEIVLSGVDLTAYGADLPAPTGLGSLIAQILKHVPACTAQAFLDRFHRSGRGPFHLIAEEERLMPHFHLRCNRATI